MERLGSMATALFCFTVTYSMFAGGILIPYLGRMAIAAIIMGVFLFLMRKVGFASGSEYLILIAGGVGFFFGDWALHSVGLSVLPLDMLSDLSASTQIPNYLILGFVALLGIYSFVNIFKKKEELS